MKEKVKILKEKLLSQGYCISGDDSFFTAMNFDTCAAYTFKVLNGEMDVKKLEMTEEK